MEKKPRIILNRIYRGRRDGNDHKCAIPLELIPENKWGHQAVVYKTYFEWQNGTVSEYGLGECQVGSFLRKYAITEETASSVEVTKLNRTEAKARADRHTETEDQFVSLLVRAFICDPAQLAAAKKAIAIVEADD